MARITVPGTNVGLLTSASKMPSMSYSLPAFKSCPSAFLGVNARILPTGERINVDKQSNCGNCYAGKGAYAWAPTKRAQEARFKWTLAVLASGDSSAFVTLMTEAVSQEATRQQKRFYRQIAKGEREYGTFQAVFRLHDSGDLFSPQYCNAWAQVAAALPDVDFWCPTRQYRSKNMHMQAALLAFAALPNVSLRPSALMFEDDAPKIAGYAAGTTASKAGFTCPAPTQANKCEDCRACWSKDIEVSYRKH